MLSVLKHKHCLLALARTALCPATAVRSPVLCMTTSTKRKMVRIGTHSGTFHADEALGCFLLRQTPTFRDAEIVRTREPEVLKDLDIIIDVGGTYDPVTRRFDHHQRGFEEVFGYGFSTKLSSAGLVYKHYGEEVVAAMAGLPAGSPEARAVYLAVYKHFMEAIDGIDNGVNQFESDKPPRYLNSTNLSARVGQLNPRWNEESNAEVLDKRFAAAVELTGREFSESVDYYAKSWLPGRSFVQQAIDERLSVDPSGEIIQLPNYCPWKEHLYELEAETGIKPIKFCIYADESGKWRVQAVSVAPGSFENRKSLPKAWQGLRDEALSEASGIPGGIFVHISGFIGGNATQAGALAMAKAALKLD